MPSINDVIRVVLFLSFLLVFSINNFVLFNSRMPAIKSDNTKRLNRIKGQKEVKKSVFPKLLSIKNLFIKKKKNL